MKAKRRHLSVHLAVIGTLLFTAMKTTALEFPTKLLSTEWLHEHLEDPTLRIVDVRDTILDYWQGHVPGAVYCNPEATRLALGGTPVMLTTEDVLVAQLGAMGITPTTPVVIYTETGDYKAPYFLWALEYLGHEQVAVINGGWGKWKHEGRPTTQDYPRITPTVYPKPDEPRKELRVTLDEMKAYVEEGGAVMLDVRTKPLYTGERGYWKRNGHIPGLYNHYWGDDLTPDGVWKSPAELRAAYEALGATPDKLIVVSCGQGTMSAHAYFTLKYVLGYPNVRNYDGSYSEWSNYDELPVKQGEEP